MKINAYDPLKRRKWNQRGKSPTREAGSTGKIRQVLHAPRVTREWEEASAHRAQVKVGKLGATSDCSGPLRQPRRTAFPHLPSF